MVSKGTRIAAIMMSAAALAFVAGCNGGYFAGVAGLSITSTSLPTGTVGAAYSTTLAATGGTTPYTWSITTGSLPAGLTLAASTGVISGTPMQSGMQSFTVQVMDSEATPKSATANLSINISSGLTITAVSLPSGMVGMAYSTTLAATGGLTPYTWSITAGSLPAGLTLAASTGVISGTPTQSGTPSFTVQVMDSEGTPATKTSNLSITISSGFTITTTTLPSGTVGIAYTATLAATGGLTPYTWSITTGSLPLGLTLAPTTGIISGTPTTTGTSNFTVQAADSEGAPSTTTANLSITINAALAITTVSLPPGAVGTAYSTTLAATGGTMPYTWSITSGSLPAGLTLAATTGVIFGTPAQSGTQSFTVQVKDSEATPKITTANLSITVNSGLMITTTTLPPGTVGTAYSTTLAASAGLTPYTWSVTGGSLPAGLTLAPTTGVISGTPTTAGTSNFTVQVQDSESTPATATGNLSITINASGGLTITSTSLPYGFVTTAYSTALTATGGTTPYTWSITSGSLPAGLTLAASAGIISGTPTQFETLTFTVQVQDSESTPKTSSLQLSITVYSGLEITTTALNDFQVNTAYNTSDSAIMNAIGGISPYTWTIVSGSLPPGLTMTATGVVTGTPTTAGNYLFQAQVQDSEGTPATLTANFLISVAANIPLSFTPPSGDGYTGTVGESFNLQLSPTNTPNEPNNLTGTAPYTWTILSGSLPDGLTFSPSGAISGTPTATGISSAVLQVVDANQNTATGSLFITIFPSALTIDAIALPDENVGYAAQSFVDASGGTSPDTFAISSGALPPGLSMTFSSPTSFAVISGTPTAPGSYPLTITVTDSNNHTASQSFTINVYQDPPCPSGNETELNGTYAFDLHGFSGYGVGYPEAGVISFTANGSGGITSAEGDINISNVSGGSQFQKFTSASNYTVGANGMGCMTLVASSGAGNLTFAFSLGGVNSGVATRGRIMSFNPALRNADGYVLTLQQPSPVATLSGELQQQNPANFALNQLAANFAFGLAGNDSAIGRFGFVGSLANSTAGAFSSVFGDWNDNGSVQGGLSGGSGGFSGTPDAQGRVPASITLGGVTYNYVAYIVNSDEVFLVSSDGINVNPIAGGKMLATADLFSSSSVSGSYIFAALGSDYSEGGQSFFAMGQINFAGNGDSISGTDFQFENDALGCSCGYANGAALAIAGTYSVDSTSGRVAVTLSGGGGIRVPVIYLTSSAQAAGFLLDTTSGAGATAFEGPLLAQPSLTYSNASQSGNFVISSGDPAIWDGTAAGEANFSGGWVAYEGDVSDALLSSGALEQQKLYSVGANGIGFLQDPSTGTGTYSFLLTNGSTVYELDYGNSGSHEMLRLEQ